MTAPGVPFDPQFEPYTTGPTPAFLSARDWARIRADVPDATETVDEHGRVLARHVAGRPIVIYEPLATKAADIPDDLMVAAVVHAARIRGHDCATRWDVATVLAGHLELVGTERAVDDWPNMPWKVVLAKAKRLIRRGVLDGCACGCRGDWEPTGPTVSERAVELSRGCVEWMTAWRQATAEMWERNRADLVAALVTDKARAAGLVDPGGLPTAEATATARAREHIGDLLDDAEAAGTDLVGWVNGRVDQTLAARERGLPEQEGT